MEQVSLMELNKRKEEINEYVEGIKDFWDFFSIPQETILRVHKNMEESWRCIDRAVEKKRKRRKN